MKQFIIDVLASMATGIVTGFVFGWLRLPIPAPPVLPAVFGIFGITIGFLLFQRFFGS